MSEFDAYAGDYDAALNQGLAVSGEDKGFFAEGRVAWLRRCVEWLGLPRPASALDYGCGTGSTIPYLLKYFPSLERVLGVDVSSASLDVARRTADAAATFSPLADWSPEPEFDLAFCNGVFHHIPPSQREEAFRSVYRALVPGGLFAYWENNPWNPGTRYVMSRIPFDRDAITLTPPESRRHLKSVGFRVLRTDYRFYFPRALAFMRPLEIMAAKVPLGAQYQVLCQRVPGSD